MPAFVYILECADGGYYVGSTRNLEHRLDQHASGRGARYTSGRLPVRLVYHLECESVGVAYGLEKRIQNRSWVKRKALIDGKFDLLPGLARKKKWNRPGE